MSNSAGNLTRSELVAAIDQANLIVVDWQDDDNAPAKIYHGAEVKVLTERVEDAWRELAEITGTDRIDDDAKALTLLIDGFLDELQRYQQSYAMSGGGRDPGGSQAMWQSWSDLLAGLQPPQAYSQPLPIDEYRAQGLNDRQIAKAYEWKNADGSPATHMVIEEAAMPGTHYQPDQWVPAHVRRERARIAEAWDRRSNRRMITIADRQVQPSLAGKAPESIEDLIRQKVSSKQIAKMKGVSQDTVKSLAADLGLPIDGMSVGPVLSASQHLARKRRAEIENEQAAAARAAEVAAAMLQEKQEAASERAEDVENLQTYAEANNFHEQVRQMTWDGVAIEKIYTALQTQYPDAKRAEVRAIAREAKKEIANS